MYIRAHDVYTCMWFFLAQACRLARRGATMFALILSWGAFRQSRPNSNYSLSWQRGRKTSTKFTRMHGGMDA